MFGLGNSKRRGRNDTFAPNRIRGAAIAGLGMLAWRWWRNRQSTGPSTTTHSQPFSESSRTPSAGAF
ncbi:MAG: hypothetical protein ACJ8BF_02105 [Gemmatimonadales bacterium]